MKDTLANTINSWELIVCRSPVNCAFFFSTLDKSMEMFCLLHNTSLKVLFEVSFEQGSVLTVYWWVWAGVLQICFRDSEVCALSASVKETMGFTVVGYFNWVILRERCNLCAGHWTYYFIYLIIHFLFFFNKYVLKKKCHTGLLGQIIIIIVVVIIIIIFQLWMIKYGKSKPVLF